MKTDEINWKYDIGDNIKDEYRDIVITNRKLSTITYENGKTYRYKLYQYNCNKCGFDCGENYRSGKYSKDYWIRETSLNKGVGCNCCNNQIIVPSINDIVTTDPWMIPYFQDGEDEAKMYSHSSNVKIYPKCPDCGKIRNKAIAVSTIYRTHSIGCTCSDGKSYPNKFAYAFLEQLQIENVQHEYNPDWLKPYFYDNYFEYNGNKYVLEMDGKVGHGNYEYKSNKKDIKGKEIDKYKDALAEKHDINVVRIDCYYSDLKHIKENILKSKINKIFDLTNIDWEYCDKFALKNIIKEVCTFWEGNNYPNYSIIKNKFNIKYDGTIQTYLEKGSKYGWCSYYKGFYNDKQKKKINIYDINHNYLGTFVGIKDFSKKYMKHLEKNFM